MKEAALKSGMNEKEIDFILEKISTKEVKDALKQTTEEALSHGVSSIVPNFF